MMETIFITGVSDVTQLAVNAMRVCCDWGKFPQGHKLLRAKFFNLKDAVDKAAAECQQHRKITDFLTKKT